MLSDSTHDSNLVKNISNYIFIFFTIISILVLLYLVMCMCTCMSPLRRVLTIICQNVDDCTEKVLNSNQDDEIIEENLNQRNRGNDVYQTIPNAWQS